MAHARATVLATAQHGIAHLAARPLPVVASARLLILATVAIRFYHLRARRAGTRMAEKQALVLTTPQRFLTGLAARMGSQPGIIRRIRHFLAKAQVFVGCLGNGIRPPTVWAWPRRRAGCVAGGRFAAAAGRTSLCLRPSPLLQTDQVKGSVATFARVLFTLPHSILDLNLLKADHAHTVHAFSNLLERPVQLALVA